MSNSTPPRKFKVEPVEMSTKSSRKFAPELLETSTKSSRKPSEGSLHTTPKRRFLPQPIETSRSSNKPQASDNSTKENRTEPRKFSPQLVETSPGLRRPRHVPQDDNLSSLLDRADNSLPTIEPLPTRRKFAPLLIDTAKRTRRAGDTRPAHLPSDRTDAIPGDVDGLRRFRRLQIPTPPDNTPTGAGSPALSTAECRKLGIPLPRKQSSQISLRQHSFRVPDLEPIDSSESGEESEPSSSLSSSPSSSSDISYQMYKHATRMRESIDASSSGYLLELAAKAAEKQLREQALAAFPNDDHHTPVDHYIGRDDDSTAMSSRSEYDHRRVGSVNWDLKDMRRHHESLEARKEREKAQREARRKWAKQQDVSPWSNQFQNDGASMPWQKDSEMERMRRKARPPMLGTDIEFPRCSSPERARFDVTQGSYSVRTAMCYLSEQSTDGACKEGLWAKQETKEASCSLWSRSNSRAPSPGGLWGGFCRGGDLSPPRGPTGLMTPRVVDEDLMNPLDIPNHSHLSRQLPPSPPPSNSGMVSLDEKLELEQAIEAEFSDEFVTQVYNYLSLGYPSLARKYDEELSKIARVSISDLRQDDDIATSRGYIRLGEDENAKEEGIQEDMCARWKALRSYIREWARQQPRMCEQNNQHGGFGVTVRKGSWAW